MFPHLDLLQFLSRFSASKEAIRNYGYISQKQIFTSKADNSLAKLDNCNKLNKISNDYLRAVNFIERNEITKKNLCKAHSILMSKKGSKFRNNHVYLGDSFEKARFIPPPPSKCDERINLMIEKMDIFSNDKIFEKALFIYSEIIMIHPFFDGNGRLARATFDGIIKRESLKVINPNFIRFSFGIDKLINFIEIINEYSISGINWKNYNAIYNFIISKTNELYEEVERTDFTVKIGNKNNSVEMINVISSLRKQPIQSLNSLVKSSLISEDKVIQSIEELVYGNFVSIRKSRENVNLVLFEFSEYMNMYNRLEKILFK